MSKNSKSRELFDGAFIATIQQEDYFQMNLIGKLGLSGNEAVIFRILLRNHAYSPNLKRIWVGNMRHSVVPEPFQLSTDQATISKILNMHKATMHRAFKHLVSASLLIYKKTKSGHLRYFVNAEFCQELLEKWENEDNLSDTTNYTLGTYRTEAKKQDKRDAETIEREVALEAIVSARVKPKPVRKPRKAVVAPPKVKVANVALLDSVPASEEEQDKILISIIDELDSTKVYPKVSEYALDQNRAFDMKITGMLKLDGLVHANVRGLGTMMADLRGMDYENQLESEEVQSTLANKIVNKYGIKTNSIVSIIHEMKSLASAKHIAVNPNYCLSKAFSIVDKSSRVDYTSERFGI